MHLAVTTCDQVCKRVYTGCAIDTDRSAMLLVVKNSDISDVCDLDRHQKDEALRQKNIVIQCLQVTHVIGRRLTSWRLHVRTVAKSV